MIPKSFQLGGRTWTVERGVRRVKWYGRTYDARALIRLSAKNETLESEEHTFLHELIHAICFTMGWERLNKNEAKIDAMASLLLQAIASMEC